MSTFYYFCNMNTNMMSLQVSEEMIKSIASEHIKASVIECLGGKDELLSALVKNICNQKVDESLRPCSYSSSKPLIEVLFINLLKDTIKEVMQEEIKKNSGPLKKTIVKAIKTEATSNQIASAMIKAFTGTLNDWRSNIKLEITTPSYE